MELSPVWATLNCDATQIIFLALYVATSYSLGMKTIRYTDAAVKQLRDIPDNDAKRIIAKAALLATNPDAVKNNVKKLQGVDGFRLRVGNYRVLFTDDGIVIEVVKVGQRGGVYR